MVEVMYAMNRHNKKVKAVRLPLKLAEAVIEITTLLPGDGFLYQPNIFVSIESTLCLRYVLTHSCDISMVDITRTA